MRPAGGHGTEGLDRVSRGVGLQLGAEAGLGVNRVEGTRGRAHSRPSAEPGSTPRDRSRRGRSSGPEQDSCLMPVAGRLPPGQVTRGGQRWACGPGAKKGPVVWGVSLHGREEAWAGAGRLGHPLRGPPSPSLNPSRKQPHRDAVEAAGVEGRPGSA